MGKLPPVLVIHLKRFEYNESRGDFVKIGTLLSMPLSLDLTEYCSSSQRDRALYKVTCVANHSGEFIMGHYTSTCYVSGSRTQNNSANGEWHHFNDGRVHRVAEANVITDQAYVIFLARCDPECNGDHSWASVTPHQTVTAPQFWPHLVSRTNSDLTNLMPGRVGQGAAIAAPNPRSAILYEEPSCEGNPRSAIVQSSDSSSTETPSLISGYTGSVTSQNDQSSSLSFGLPFEVASPSSEAPPRMHSNSRMQPCFDANVANVPITLSKKELRPFSLDEFELATSPFCGLKPASTGRRRTRFDCC